MERVKMQMMLHERTGTVLTVAGGIYRAEGVPGFWRGNGAPNPFAITHEHMPLLASPVHCKRITWPADWPVLV